MVTPFRHVFVVGHGTTVVFNVRYKSCGLYLNLDDSVVLALCVSAPRQQHALAYADGGSCTGAIAASLSCV